MCLIKLLSIFIKKPETSKPYFVFRVYSEIFPSLEFTCITSAEIKSPSLKNYRMFN